MTRAGPVCARPATRWPWVAGLAYGVLWGIAVMALETMSFATLSFGGSHWLAIMGALLGIWITRGIALAWGAQWLAARVSARVAWAGFVALSIALSLTWDGIEVVSDVSQGWLGILLPSHAQWLYNQWVLFAYGAPLFAFCVLGERERRTRDLLARAEIARANSAAALAALRYEALAQRIEPQLLLRSLRAARLALASNRARAQRLLDDLVAFLRSAMPGLRSGQSTAAAESRLVDRYVQLMQGLDGGAPLCQVQIGPLPEDPPLPPLLLLPVIEAAHAARQTGSRPMRLTLAARGPCASLRLEAQLRSAWLPPELEHRLKSQLDACHAAAWRIDIGGTAALEVLLPFSADEEQTHRRTP